MKCTEKEFADEFFAKKPGGYIFKIPCYSSITNQMEEYVMGVEYHNAVSFANLSDFNARYNLASAIWYAGSVVEDRMGLFSPLSPPSINISLPPGFTVDLSNFTFDPSKVAMNWDLSKDINTLKPPKCECGAHAVGSSGHSSWCPIKE